MKATIKKSVAIHLPSDCLLIGSNREIDPSIEDVIIMGATNWKDHCDVVYDREEGYNAEDEEQEHEEEYSVIEKEYVIDVDGEEEKLWAQYKNEKSRYEHNRDNYYGYCGDRREFSKMYGDGEFFSFEKRLCVKHFS